ncbi:hypothetical protein BABINDRAFT_160100 [Babjeviella inositovora NRRL Y-12698]|uniref:Uncharacterized protein n=1 Tax=Babjeviella inositovora NRRL Y-12698 TaxID=984486 RepID=A0A1E3QW30_9ASCO|nr:uncharacterized protein BABINDRAFT_160100 [Babjeviella inositovora NRRL Y-12698]ODQ81870.1 hypothetical protein BABINDRAFT_160100 [Babjeviella inositovora NRRL Y-12698]
MRIPSLILIIPLLVPVTAEWYPRTGDDEVPPMIPYDNNQEIPLECTQRDVENNGEHKFDENMNVLYAPFPLCAETGKPIAFHYGTDAEFNCTFSFTDELFHQFQYYVHEDAPFSCRLPLSNPDSGEAKSEKAYIPLRFNFRGNIQESHLDIDDSINVLFTSAIEQNTPISAISWSSSTEANRYVIGDSMTLKVAVKWFKTSGTGTSETPINGGFYKLPNSLNGVSTPVYILSLIVCILLTAGGVYGIVYSRFSKKAYTMGYRPTIDHETAVGKKD